MRSQPYVRCSIEFAAFWMLVLMVGAASIVGPGSHARADIGPIPCSPAGCGSGCFPLGPGSNEYNDCLARCSSGPTSNDLTAVAGAAFADDVRNYFPYPDADNIAAGYAVCKALSERAYREDIEQRIVNRAHVSDESAEYFVGRVLSRLCPGA
jgi:hypothetical protein